MIDYHNFFEKLKKMDSRIEYSEGDYSISLKKHYIPEFYSSINPINVEFEYRDGIVRLISIDELEKINAEYDFVKEGTIFATCNGEPIYVNNGRVYTCICGEKKVIEEVLADSIELFFKEIEDV